MADATINDIEPKLEPVIAQLKECLGGNLRFVVVTGRYR